MLKQYENRISVDSPFKPEFEGYINSHPGRGSLRVQVSAANRSFPVKNVFVEVAVNDGGVRYSLYQDATDESGIVNEIVLPTCKAGDKEATAIISGGHTRFVTPAQGKEEPDAMESAKPCDNAIALTMRLVYYFATTAPLDEIRFMQETRTYNMNAAREALKGNYGHNLGKTIDRPLSKGIFGNSIFCHIISRTASACDARMGGAMIPVMSNSGSGNQGICATNPVCVYAKENENTEEELIRALTLSHLTAIYIKQSLGTLSALCGCVVASIGSSCGITYLMGGDYEHICRSVKNMIANLTGMICDGAKPSCSLKITSGVSTAVLSALLSMEGKCVSSAEGIVDDCVDQSIHNLTAIGADGMGITDEMVLSIMTSKSHPQCPHGV